MKRFLLFVFLALVLAGGYGALEVKRRLEPAAIAAEPQIVVIAAGTGLRGIATQLEEAGLIRDARVFEGLARFQEVHKQLRAGEYELSATQTPAEILDTIVSGRIKLWPVAVPEGLTAVEIAARVEAAGLANAAAFLAVVNDPASPERFGVEGPGLEGYLFPETYHLAHGLTADEVVAAFLAQFKATWDPLAASASARGLTMRKAVTLASIVEKETAVPDERPIVAAVFHNRMKIGMRLETDPTVIYGIPNFDGNLTRAHLEDESNPYNTYRIAGLPPGPIANPGAGALRAAVEPGASDALFFVSRNDGSHVFSRSYAEHVNNVQRFQVRREGNDGD
jgi:UPF0755 protein